MPITLTLPTAPLPDLHRHRLAGRCRVAALLVAPLLGLLLSGCATFELSKAMPAQSQPVSVAVTDEELSGWSDMPPGVYRIPDSQVVMSGHQTGGVGVLLFGVVGLAVSHVGNSGAAAQTVRDAERVLRMRVSAPVDAALRRQLADGPHADRVSMASGPQAARVRVVPALVITKVAEQQYVPFLVLKVTMPDGTSGRPAWSTRYIAGLGQPRPLVGEGSWTADQGAALAESLRINAERATQVMVRDMASPLPRDKGEVMLMQAHHAFVARRLQTKGRILEEDDSTIVYMPQLGDVIVFTGVNILDKSQIVYRVARDQDMPFMVVDTEPKKP